MIEYRALPPKAHCFNFVAPANSTVDSIVDGFDAVLGPKQLDTLQHQGGMRFCVVVVSAAAAAKLNAAGCVTLSGVKTPVQCIGPKVIVVSVLRLLPFISEADLGTALSAYGRVMSIQYPTFKGFSFLKNGQRIVKIEMRKPIPNFLEVRGVRVRCKYRGVKRVCARCNKPGHNGNECKALWCARCLSFGHED